MKNTSFRTRFGDDIVAEVLFPTRQEGRVVIFCSGAPSTSSKKELLQFLTEKGYTVMYPRYRGTWESQGEFLKLSPHQDVLDIIDELIKKKKIFSIEEQKWFPVKIKEFILMSVSFGGPAVLLASRHPMVRRVVALAPVIDWKVAGPDEPFPWWQKYMETAFGGAYRASKKNWRKLERGKFYSPLKEMKKIDGGKLLLFHARNDRIVPIEPTIYFAQATGAKLIIKEMGGHLSSRVITYKRNWKVIEAFLKQK